MSAAETRLWPALTFRDADRMLDWLQEVGFTEHATYRSEADASVVEHAEWLWPGGGGVMLGSVRDGGALDNVGGGAVYLVTDADDTVDGVFARAVAAGATIDREPADQPYGGRGAAVRDPEGNHWSFGSYQPQ